MSGQGLTEEQKKKIEENRKKALARRAERLGPVGSSNLHSSISENSSHFEKLGCSRSQKTSSWGQKSTSSHPVSTSTSGDSVKGNKSTSWGQKSTSSHPISTSTSGDSVKGNKSNLGSTTNSKEHSWSTQNADSSLHISVNFSKQNVSLNLTMNSKPASTNSIIGNAGENSKEKPAVVNNSVQSIPTNKFFGLDKSIIKGRCVLISRDRFSVVVGFHGPLIDYFKQLETRMYDVSTRTWSFLLQSYKTFMKGVAIFQPEVQIEGLPLYIQQHFICSRTQMDEVPEANLSQVDQKLVDTLMPFQREGVHFAIHQKGRLLLADDMGLGKTLQAICIAAYYKMEWPLLVVSPSSVRFDWAQQICKWLPSVDPQEVNVVESGKDNAAAGLVNIISYDLLSKKATQMKGTYFNVIIMDESHFLKNIKTARTKAALQLLKNSKRVILLSGTPALSRPKELFTQIISVCPSLFGFHEYGIRYCDAKQHPWGWDYSGSSNMTELQLLLEKKIMIRRLKKHVLSQLPAKTRQIVVLNPKSIKVNKDLKQASKVMGKTNLKESEKRGALLQYFRETCTAKLTAVRDYLVDLLESEKKFLVFAHHKEMLDNIEESILLHASNLQYVRIDGRTNSEQRNYFCKLFQTRENYKVAILSITAANAGLNLSAANMVVFAELFWNPGILVQAEDRAHRIGQQDSVSVQYLMAKSTADDYIWPLVQEKLSVLGKAGLTKDDFSTADTRCLNDSRNQTVLDMFRDISASECFDEESIEKACNNNSPTKVTLSKRRSEENLLSTPTKSGTQGSKKKISRLTPPKNQPNITSFFPSSPVKHCTQLFAMDKHKGLHTVEEDEIYLEDEEFDLQTNKADSNVPPAHLPFRDPKRSSDPERKRMCFNDHQVQVNQTEKEDKQSGSQLLDLKQEYQSQGSTKETAFLIADDDDEILMEVKEEGDVSLSQEDLFAMEDVDWEDDCL